jgi:hypothetical protein
MSFPGFSSPPLLTVFTSDVHRCGDVRMAQESAGSPCPIRPAGGDWLQAPAEKRASRAISMIYGKCPLGRLRSYRHALAFKSKENASWKDR